MATKEAFKMLDLANNSVRHFDCETGVELTAAQSATIEDCPIPTSDWEEACIQIQGNLDASQVAKGWLVTSSTVAGDGSVDVLNTQIFDLPRTNDLTATHEVVECPSKDLIPIGQACYDDAAVPIPQADTRCTSYGSFGSTSLAARLTNPALFDDPPLPGDPSSPDFSCLDHYPIDVVVYDIQITTDAGATWGQASELGGGPVVVTTWNNAGDVPAARSQVMTDYLNGLTSVQNAGITFSPNGARWDVDKPSGYEVRALYGFIYNSNGDPACRLDPFHRDWTDDFNIMGSDGDAVWLFNMASTNSAWVTTAPTPADYAVVAAAIDITTESLNPMETCNPI